MHLHTAVSTNSVNTVIWMRLIWLIPWAKKRCSQECMVINYGKLIPEENLSEKLIKKLFRKTQLYNYIKRCQKTCKLLMEAKHSFLPLPPKIRGGFLFLKFGQIMKKLFRNREVSWKGEGHLRRWGVSKLFHQFSFRKACFHYYWIFLSGKYSHLL